MGKPESSERERILADFVWYLARRHGWGGRVLFDSAVNEAFPDSEVGRAREVLRPLLKSFGVSFLHWSESDEETVRMRGDRRVEVAYYLRDEAGYEEYRIETYVSRFGPIDGGFDETTPPDDPYVDWPD